MKRLYAYDTSEEEYKANITIPKNHNIASADSRDLNYPVETGRFHKIFEVQETLGEGGFGQVYKAIHRLDKDVYAVKKVAIREQNSNKLNTTIERMLREVSTMKKLNHKSIVRYITCWIEEGQNEELSEEHENIERVVSRKNYKSKVISNDSDGCSYFAFEKFERNSQDDSEEPRESESLEFRDKEKLKPKSLDICLFIQLEYCAGMTLRNFIGRPKSERPVATMAEMFSEIVDGVNAFHKAGIFHRDLKPENIFLHGSESLKIGDFGLAVNHIDRSKEHNDQIHLTHKIGTRFYMSPEMKFNLDYNYKTDIYALGIIFYEMLLELGSAHERSEVLTKIGSKEISEGFKKEFPDESKLILRMVDHAPEKRPDAGEIIAEILRIKNCYHSQRFKVEEAEVIGYNDNIAANPPPLTESLFVKNSKGITFSIRQGLKGDVVNNPPSIGKIITFKYEIADPKGVPFNPIYKGYDIKPKKLEEPAPILMPKNQDSDEKFIEEQAEVIGYDGTMMDNPPPIIESLLVQNSKGVFKIIQGLKGKVRSAPPSKGQIITFKYETTDSKGQPANAIYIKK